MVESSLDESSSEIEKEFLGQILVRRNLISSQQLAHALNVQKQEGQGYIGEILVKLGFLEERDVVVALIVQCNIPYIAVDKYDLDKNVVTLVPKDFALKNFIVPLDRVGDVLSVVMADPLNQTVKSELQRLTNYRIAAFIATKKEIENALEKFFL